MNLMIAQKMIIDDVGFGCRYEHGNVFDWFEFLCYVVIVVDTIHFPKHIFVPEQLLLISGPF